MRHVVGPIFRAHGMIVSNVFILDGGRGDRFLVDTGHPLERVTLLANLRRFRPRDFTGVLLTHRHSDHAGNAAFLRKHFGIPIFAHARDAEVLEGKVPQRRLRARGLVERAMVAIEHRTYARVPVDRALEDGDTIGSLEVHHVAGHTEGSVLYRHEGTLSLLSGDALLAAIPPLTLRQGMSLPHPDFSEDWRRAIDSLKRFHASGARYENLLAGHGRPVLGRAREKAERLFNRE